jgi:predicted anti-sigma-YlaC factor YlaD
MKVRHRKGIVAERMVIRPKGRLLIVALAVLLLTACSIKRTAVNILGDALAGGSSACSSDNDPELVRQAIPFGLKTLESLLQVSPEHKGILLSAASGFTAYAYLLQDEADRLDKTDLLRARTLRSRACKLYLRARDYALRGLELAHPHFKDLLKNHTASAITQTTREDIPFLYWAGASWAGALTSAKDDLHLVGELPIAAALIQRILQLDETYEGGVAHEFFISYEGSHPGGSALQARRHYLRALELSGGHRASIHLALAESVSIREQNVSEFRALLAAAMAVDPDKVPHLRLANTITRQRACWLLAHIPDLFLETEEKEVRQ